MKYIKIIFLFSLSLTMSCASYPQKQSFDVVVYKIPKGWTKTVTENGVQLSAKDDGKGNYAAAVIVRSVASTATPNENFNNSWQSLVKGTVQVSEAPSMSDMDIEKGWQCITGQANYTDGNTKGLVTLITATGNGKMANVVIMTNTSKYQEEVLAFVNSLELNETATAQNNSGGSSAKVNTGVTNTPINSPLTGKIWEGTTTEKFANAGGTSYNTGGFSTNQYVFNTNGTYRFVSVIASHFTDTKSLAYETGTYTINGNKLTITPAKGFNEEWSKIGKTSNGNSDVGNRAINDTWGKKIKTTNRKSEQVTYTFSIGKNGDRTALLLQYANGHTEREGNGNQTYLNEIAAERSVKLPGSIN